MLLAIGDQRVQYRIEQVGLRRGKWRFEPAAFLNGCLFVFHQPLDEIQHLGPGYPFSGGLGFSSKSALSL